MSVKSIKADKLSSTDSFFEIYRAVIPAETTDTQAK